MLLLEEDIDINGVKYSKSDFFKLHNKNIPINYGFDKNKEFCNYGKFVWHDDKLFFKFWLEKEDLDEFKNYIFEGKMVPISFKLCLDNITKNHINMLEE